MRYVFIFLIIIALLSGCVEKKQIQNVTFRNETIKEFTVLSVNETNFTYINDVFHQTLTVNMTSKIEIRRNASRTVLIDECYNNSVSCHVLYIEG